MSSTFYEVPRIFKGLCEGEVEKPEDPDAGKSKKTSDKFLGAKFRMQMKELMDELNSCDCHFIRCIKPNEAKQKELWVSMLALQQIRYLGVLESIKVRKESYPVRRPYQLFYQRYGEVDSQPVSFLKLVEQKADFRALTEK
jgi:myosin heavy subunit